MYYKKTDGSAFDENKTTAEKGKGIVKAAGNWIASNPAVILAGAAVSYVIYRQVRK